MNETTATDAAYAGLGQRGLAFLIDSLAWLFLLGQIASSIPEGTYEDSPAVVGVVFLVLLSLAFNYFWLTEWKWGKTVGKAVVSIHVEGEDGERPRFGPTTIRNILRLVDIFFIGPLLIASSDRRQRLGDRLGHTVVVRDEAAPAAQPSPQPAVATAGAAPTPTPTVVAAQATPAPPAPTTAPRKRSPWAESIGIPEPGWGPTKVLWGTLAAIGALIVETGVIAAFDPEIESTAAQLSLQALLAFNLFAVSLGFASPRASPLARLHSLGLRGFAASALGITALAYVAYIVFAAVWYALVQPEQEDVTRELGFDEGGLAAVIAGFLIVAVAPLSEEIFFRGFMYGGLRRRLPVWVAAVISGVVFGLVHYTGPDSIGVVPQLAVLGILLAWLYERTGSLWPPILLHLLNNSLALVVITSS
ncbi:MAG TPA: CPBP family glutamic-type intramembrane protease [Solirubrobacterales bacterium]|nr:CPBP family glutamic-type intramembrane protease [Solirubrobacterales bacterium]